MRLTAFPSRLQRRNTMGVKMPLSNLSDPAAVLKALAEYDQLGKDAFLARYGYGPSRTYFLIHDGKRYDSKAIAGVAHGDSFQPKVHCLHTISAGAEELVTPL